jgi:hypothetical protein
LHVFNLVLKTGTFPEELKLAKVIPIYKEGDKAECGNYRPISVIPALTKIVEKLICDQLTAIWLSPTSLHRNSPITLH